MEIKLQNEYLEVTVNSFGAELSSITGKETGTQFLWDADERFWKRTSPVLFPFVGSLKDKKYTFDGNEYSMGQHGFARDMEFTLVSADDTRVMFELLSSKETLEKYPFEFELRIGYELEGSQIKVLWQVKNKNDINMPFSIGAHPAFMCPVAESDTQSDYYIRFNTTDDISYRLLNADGLLEKDVNILSTDEEGCCKVGEHMFDNDALIIEGGQASAVSLCTADKKPYVTVDFDAPLFGIWSPAKKNAPFICIEPWYGRCDSADFDGNLEDREYTNIISPDSVFEADYTIKIAD